MPELKEIKDGKVHTVWTLANNALSKAGVSLGETYPNPVVVAPEWSRHYGKVRESDVFLKRKTFVVM